MQLPARYPICLLLGYALYAAEPDQAISLALRRAVADVHHVRVWYRASVDSDLDLVIALGSPANWPPGSGKADWWSDKRALGLFLQRRDQPALIYQIAAEKGSADADCYALIERATATDVVISCTPEKGRRGPNRKFVYDIRAKALVKRIDYAPFAMSRVFVSDDGAVLVGSDYTRLVAVEYRPARASPFRVLTGAEAVQWTGRVRTTASTVGVGAGLRNEIYIEPETFKPVHFGAGNRFTLTQEEKTSLLVLEQTPQHLERFPLPQLSYEEFARARPQRVKDGYSKSAAQINDGIGPWQMAEGRVWFGKTFYDGEGMTGVGGFGYFNPAERKYQIYSPPEVADWSVTAILVESDAVWLGLAHGGEWGSSGGGLAIRSGNTERGKV